MRSRFAAAALCAAPLLTATAALAQQPAPAADTRPPLPPLAVPNPHYVSLSADIVVERPARQLWQRIGGFCDIGSWVGRPCQILSGRDRELGTVRLVNNRVVEVLVGKSELSFTYAYPVRVGEPYNGQHGTIEAIPLGPKRTRVVYSVVYDDSLLPDEAARSAQLTNLRSRLQAALQRMKTLNEAPAAK